MTQPVRKTETALEVETTRANSARPEPARSQQLSSGVIALLACACGLSVANVYFAHPLLDAIAASFDVQPRYIGIVVTVTQVGYALGLLFVVPLGDRLNRRRLVVTQGVVSAAALAVVGTAPTIIVMLAALFVVGLSAVVIQILVAFAADFAAPDQRGRAVGLVTSGVVTGILLSRLIAGGLSDFAGWRAVYLISAILTLAMALVLRGVLPAQDKDKASLPYLELLGSALVLLRDEPVLRVRSFLALSIFAAFNVLWAPLALALGGPPYSLSHGQIGLFGLAGLAGALAASKAGKLADQGWGQWTTGMALGLMVVAWLPIAFLGTSLSALTAGVILLDFGIQAVHVTSQSMLFALRQEARSRVVGVYMMFYSIGSAAGAIGATAVYGRAGWIGVSVLGAAISAAALVVWAITRRRV